ncbi:hypothetical protein Tco_0326323, partial [Tanacetum coccineum]
MSTENGAHHPAPTLAYKSNFLLLSVLGRERITGPNYMDWMQNLRFTLRYVYDRTPQYCNFGFVGPGYRVWYSHFHCFAGPKEKLEVEA